MPRLRYRLALKKSLYLSISSAESGSPLTVERAWPNALMLSASTDMLAVVTTVDCGGGGVRRGSAFFAAADAERRGGRGAGGDTGFIAQLHVGRYLRTCTEY